MKKDYKYSSVLAPCIQGLIDQKRANGFSYVDSAYMLQRFDRLCENYGLATVELPIDDCDKFAQWLLEEFSWNGKTVMVAPATGFYSTEGLGTREVRIAYVLKKEDLEDAVACLAEALKTYPGRTL